MKKILFALAAGLLISAQEAKADTIVGIHAATYHFDREAGYKEFNPGVYIVTDSLTAGVYANSERKISVYAGYSFQHQGFGLTVGGVTGYTSGVLPMIVPSYKIPGTAIRISYLPQVPSVSQNTQAIHISFEF